MIRGIDISHYQDGINLDNLPKDISFVSLKGTQGVTIKDDAFQRFYHTLKTDRPEIVRIDYHFFDWETDGILQAKNVLSRGVNYTEPGTGPLMLDLEADSGSAVETYIIHNRALCIQRVNDFITYIRANCGRQELIIYSNDDFIKNVICHTWPDTIFWVASYQKNPPPFITGWGYHFWQYCEFGRLDGTCGKDSSYGSYDLDFFLGTQIELDALANR
ncbi:MAG: lysozyme [Mucilaginibacter sp.]|nr:lysozyme [Mucilaginibacter sp.]